MAEPELHLLQYKKRMLEYLQVFGRKWVSPLRAQPLHKFSGPYDTNGYAATSVTDDGITDVFLEFSERTRQKESEKYLRTLTGRSQTLHDKH
jgi:hypothetical protein